MEWPSDITDAYAKGIEVDPNDGFTKADVIQHLLDETAKRAVWRAKADPGKLEDAYRSPYTPLGSVTVECVMDRAKSLTIKSEWCEATDLLYDFVNKKPQLICDAFKDEQVEYYDGIDLPEE